MVEEPIDDVSCVIAMPVAADFDCPPLRAGGKLTTGLQFEKQRRCILNFSRKL